MRWVAFAGALLLPIALAAALTRTELGRGWLRTRGWLAPVINTAPYREQVEAFAQANRQLEDGCTLLLGDSLTALFPPELARNWANRGISGDRVQDLAARLDRSVANAPCETVALLIGSNDLVNDGAAPHAVETGIRDIAGRLAEDRRRVLVLTLPPTRDHFKAANKAIQETNTRIRDAKWPNRVVLVDLNAPLADAYGTLASRFSRDGLHLTPEAYVVWADLVKRKLPPQAGAPNP